MHIVKKVILALATAMRAIVPPQRVGWRNFARSIRREQFGVFSPAMRRGFFAPSGMPMLAGGATNQIHKPGYQLSLVLDHPAAPNSGDPVRFGVLTGVALLDEGEGGAGATETVTDLGPGVWDLTVDDNEGTGIAVGDTIYYHDTGTGTGSVNLNNTATSMDAVFGIALEVVSANATTLINVQHIPLGATIALASNAVVTGSITDGAVTSAKVAEGMVQVADVQLTNAEVLAFRASPFTLVAAPGADKAIIIHAFHIVSDDAGGAWTESTDNLVIQYADGVDISAAIEAGSLVGGAVQFVKQGVLDTVIVPDVNAVVQIFNTGDGEWGGGNAANTMSIRCWYSVVDTVAFS